MIPNRSRVEVLAEDATARARRYLDTIAMLAWSAGAGTAAVTAWWGFAPVEQLDLRGMGVILAPTVFGLINAVVLVCGELVLRRRLGRMRQAALVRRTIRDLAGTRLPLLCAAALAFLIAVVASGAVLTESDGRTLAFGTPGSRWLPISGFTAGIFPGPTYGLPLVIGAVLVTVGCVAALYLIKVRPAIQDVAEDVVLRRRSVRRVLRACAATLLVADGGACFMAGCTVAEAFADGPWFVAGLFVAAVGGLLAAGGFVVSLLPGANHGWRQGQEKL